VGLGIVCSMIFGFEIVMIFCALEFQLIMCGIESMIDSWYVKLDEWNDFDKIRVLAGAGKIWVLPVNLYTA